MNLVRVGKKYQIRIPATIREVLALAPDAKLVAQQKGDRLELIPNAAPGDGESVVTVRDRFQFTLPVRFRRNVGITEKDLLTLHIEEGSLIVTAKLIERTLESLTKRATRDEPSAEQPTFVSSGLEQLAKQSKFRRKKSVERGKTR